VELKKSFRPFLLKSFFVVVLSILVSAYVQGAYLRNVPQTLTQPDGALIQCLASGDEFYNWLHDSNDYTIIQDPQTGYYVYAVKTLAGELVPSSFIVGRYDPKSLGLEKGLRISPQQIMKLREAHFEGLRQVPAPHTGTFNNLVIFIRFSGESEYTNTISGYDSNFNGPGGSNGSLHTYYDEASYNKISILTYFFPNRPGATVVSYQDSHPRGYYQPYNAVTNPIGYTTDGTIREHTLLKNAVNFCASQISAAGLNIDGDNDGYVDNVCFIVSGNSDGWSDLLWPHMWELFSYDVRIGTKRVWTYNFQLNGTSGPGPSVLCHEMGHSLGAPDLYRYYNTSIVPVGNYDLMAWNTSLPQHMGAYIKNRYMTWIASIPTITTSGTYTLNPITSATGNCYKIASPNSTTEYFVVEFRKRTGFDTGMCNSYGEGLLVYRINTAVADGNANGPPDEVYIYRTNGTLSANGLHTDAMFGSDKFRTAINDSTNPSSFLSTGGPGGLNISSIGSVGNTISFYVTIAGGGGDPYEPNDTRAQAYAATLSGTPPAWTSSGAGINSSSDQDWYKFSAAAGDVITALCHPTSSLDAKAVLYFGDTLKASRDATGSGGDETLTYTCAEAGTFYVGIGYYGSISVDPQSSKEAEDGLPANTGTYTLTITKETNPDPYEPNDTRAQAYAATLSGSPPSWTSAGAKAEPSTDQDWFKFSASAGDLLTVTCHPTSSLDGKIVLYYGDTLIASRDVGGSGGDEILTSACAATGTYYVGIGYYGSLSVGQKAGEGDALPANTGAYTLTIQKSAPAITKDDFVGVWTGQGIYYRNSDTGQWVLKETSTASQVAVGDLDGDGIGDIIGIFPSDPGVWVKKSITNSWTKLDSMTPNWIAAGDMNGDGRADFLGAWNNGIYYKNSISGNWVLMETSSASKIAAGDLDGDGKADLIGVFPSDPGVWVKKSTTNSWTRIDIVTPNWIAAGDMNGDGRADFVGAWNNGVYYKNSISGLWVLMETSSASMIATGDLDGDGKKDLIGVFPSDPGVSVKRSSTNTWQKLDTTTPVAIAAGRMRAGGSPEGAELSGRAPSSSTVQFLKRSFEDLSMFGPHGQHFIFAIEKNP
jgi:M6 family metalloprotease-like protein